MKRRVLMLAYYYPPLGGIGSVRALKFAHYLPEFGWEPTVIAPRSGSYYLDPRLQFDATRVIRTGSLEMSRIAKRIVGAKGGDTRSAEGGRGVEAMRRLIRTWIYRPDAQIGWYPFAVTCGRRVMRQQKFDAVFSSSFPITAHLVASRLRREYGIPWVAEFRDLWTDLARYDSPRRRRLDQTTERSVLTDASEVITVSETYAKLLSTASGRTVRVITNGFDPIDFPEASDEKRCIAAYVGTYYPDRQDLGTALRALGELTRCGRLSDVTLRIVGECQGGLRSLLEAVGWAGPLECTGFVGHTEALRLMAESALLLLAGPAPGMLPASSLRGNIAAKVFEYLGSRRPILCVGDLESDVATLVGEYAGVACVAPGDVEGAKKAILQLMREGSPTERQRLERYTRRALSHQLAEVLSRAR